MRGSTTVLTESLPDPQNRGSTTLCSQQFRLYHTLAQHAISLSPDPLPLVHVLFKDTVGGYNTETHLNA